MNKIYLVFILCIFFVLPCYSENIVVGGLTDEIIQAAIDGANDGDVLILPPGTGVVDTMITCTLDNITIVGQGVNETILEVAEETNGLNMSLATGSVQGIHFKREDGATGAEPKNYLLRGWNDLVIADCKFSGIVEVGVWMGTSSESYPHGSILASRCEFRAQPGTLLQFQLIRCEGSMNLSYSEPPDQNTGIGTYYYEPGFSSDEWFWLENCTFWQDEQGDSSIETYYGAKVMIRNSTGTNFLLGVHGNDSSNRSGHFVIVHDCQFTEDLGSDMPAIYLTRGGGALWFNNTMSGTSPDRYTSALLQSFRSRDDEAVWFEGYDAGHLDGTHHWDGNLPYDEYSTGTHDGADSSTTLTDTDRTGGTAWPADHFKGASIDGYTGTASAADQLDAFAVWNITDGSVGQATANTSNTYTVSLTGGDDNTWQDGDEYVITHGYPGLDQVGRVGPTRFVQNEAATQYIKSTQTLFPLYFWGNEYNSSGNSNDLEGSVDYLYDPYQGITWPDPRVMIQEDRDFFHQTSGFDGTSGMGVGTKAQMNAITPTLLNVAFWVTDEAEWDSTNSGNDGQLYAWDGDSWEIIFTPPTYPHLDTLPELDSSTHTAASASQSDVQDAVDLASDGDTVLIPDGTATWTSGISTTKQIIIRAQNYTPTEGGTMTRNVTITNGVTGGPLLTFQSGDDYHCGVGGIFFDHSANTPFIYTTGSGSKPPLVFDCAFDTTARFGSAGSTAVCVIYSLGFVGWNLRFDGSDHPASGSDVGNSIGGNCLHFKSPNRLWTTASTLGALDTNGNVNAYFEDSTFHLNGSNDVDDHARVVVRYCTINGTPWVTHGFTSSWGGRFMEFYNNTFSTTEQPRNLAGRYVWFRAGHGLFTDNEVLAAPTGDYAQPSLMTCVIEAGTNNMTWDGSYFKPRQVGTGHNGSAYVSDPIYSWNNTGARASSLSGTSDTPGATLGVDIIVDSGAKPGYVKYEYPHPFREVIESESDDGSPSATTTNLIIR